MTLDGWVEVVDTLTWLTPMPPNPTVTASAAAPLNIAIVVLIGALISSSSPLARLCYSQFSSVNS
jgi:hypothetical protein